MNQKSSKNLSTLSKHMTNDTKLQVNQNTVATRLITSIPMLSAANANPIIGELYVDSTHLLSIHKINILYYIFT